MNVLAIDQGTSATKAVVAGPGQEILGAAEVPVATRACGDAVEADPEQLLESVLAAGRQALAAARAPADAVALANQGETVLAWDRRTGRPLTPAIVWQDRRSAGVCARLAPQAGWLAQVTGLPLDPYFAAPKMTWLRENLTRDGVVTTTDTWLLARLGAGYVTDAATASRTMLLDLDGADWSARACAAFGLDPAALPAVADCAGIAGETAAFGPALPVTGLAVDQQAALAAQGCLAAGQAKCTYGTGAFLLAATGEQAVRSSAGLSASVAWRLAGRAAYCLDGQVYTAGSAVRWLTEVGITGSAAELDAAGASVPDAGGVQFVPALAGLGAPHWRPDARGAFLGLSLSTSRAHLIRAVLDGLAAAVALLARSVAADLGAPLTVLRADGGLTRSRLLLQAQADLLQVPVEVFRSPDATALGVAALARLGAGAAASLAEAVGPAAPQQVIEPSMSPGQAAQRLADYEAALRLVLAGGS
ncbi:MAG TPA: FGGY family carbohydrate kinase [Streptosporangiaceae bacterium]|nr:FGGY family carbohydrate kinase [Streptosporangiaceae bacterium]